MSRKHRALFCVSVAWMLHSLISIASAQLSPQEDPHAAYLSRQSRPSVHHSSPIMRRLWESEPQTQLVDRAVFTQSLRSNADGRPIFLATPPNYSSGGSGTVAVAVGDFNSDGKADIVLANSSSDSDCVSVLLGNGDGSFTVPHTYVVGSNPVAVAIGDFNADGKPDLAVVNQSSDSVSILLGNGDGTFQAPQNYGAGFYPVSLAVGDFNHDGKSDLVITSQCGDDGCNTVGHTVSVLLGNGNGTFQLPKVYEVGNSPTDVVIFDFNRDGNADLAVTNQDSGSVSVLMGNGDGTFRTAVNYSATDRPLAAAVGDLNGDGYADLAIVNDSGVSVLIGNADGSFQAAMQYSVGNFPTAIAVGDFNGDGRLDVAAANLDWCTPGGSDFGTTSVLMGKGDGTFQPAVAYNSAGCSTMTGGPLSLKSMAVADFNGDGRPDLAVPNGFVFQNPGGGVSVLLGNGDGTFPAAVLDASVWSSSDSYSVAVGDFNGDGNADLAVANLSGSISVLFGDGRGMLAAAVNYSSGGQESVGIAVGDFNGDGTTDLAVANEGSNTVSVLLGNRNGTFQTARNSSSGGLYPTAVAVGDFNGDGKLDVAVANNCMDSNCVTGSVSVLLGNGDGTFQLPVSYASGGTSALGIVVGDFNGDGHLDLAVAANCPIGVDCDVFGPRGGAVGILIGNGDGTFQPAVTYVTSVGAGAYSLAVADLDNDGNADLVVANGASCSDCSRAFAFSVLIGDGNGSFHNGSSYGGGGPIRWVVAGDFNGDGKADVAVAKYCGDGLDCVGGSTIVFMGNGDGTFQASEVEQIMLRNLAIGDFNNDGKPDLAASLQFDTGASLLLNVGATAAATTTTVSPSAPQSYSVFQPVTFAAQVHHTGAGAPTGTVQFFDSGVLIGAGSVDSSGQAAFTTTGLVVGSHFVVAYYRGDSNFAPSNSLGVHVTINKASTRLALISSVNPSGLGQPVTFTARITPQYGGQASGTITFKDGATPLGSAAVSGNSASLTTSGLAIGTHCITAVYGGDANFTGRTSAPLTQVVTKAKATTTTTLVSSMNPSVSGKPVSFTATVSSSAGTPTGKVQFLNGTTVLATLTLTSGSAKYTTSKLSPGPNIITAVYLGDSNNNGSTSAPVNQFVLAATTTTLKSSPNPSTYGQTVVFTATVTSSIGAPPDGETVTFKQGATVLGTGTLSGGTATLSISTLGVGTKSVTAVYGGDSNFDGSTSKAVKQVVNKATTTTALASSQNPSNAGQSVTFTAIVTPEFSGKVTGTVTFYDGATALKTVSMSSGVAKFKTSTLNSGTHTITATYNGSASFISSSASLPQTVN